MGLSQPEQQLLDALKAYELQLPVSIANYQKTGVADSVAQSVINDVSSIIPGGALAAKLISSAIAIIKGRTFESDNYAGAMFYIYFVAGNSSVNSTSQVADQDVQPSLQWFIRKLGVYVSGREHLLALQQGAQQYMALHNVNSYTTIDLVRVNLAVQVMQTYMPNATIGQVLPGSWSKTVGVYDNAALAQLETARVNDPNALTDTSGTNTTGLNYLSSGTVAGIPIMYVIVALIAVFAIIYFMKKNK